MAGRAGRKILQVQATQIEDKQQETNVTNNKVLDFKKDVRFEAMQVLIDMDDNETMNERNLDEESINNIEINFSSSIKANNKKKAKNKKKNKAMLNSSKTSIIHTQEMNIELLSIKTTDNNDHSAKASDFKEEIDLFRIDRRKINYVNDITKIFGKSMDNKRKPNSGIRNRIINEPRDNWPITNKLGVTMSLLKKENNINYYTFKHSKNYQDVQSQFMLGLMVHNHEASMNLLQSFPYHVDSLLQYAEICRINGENQIASDLIEKAIYVHELAFEPGFNYFKNDCKLDYKIMENRSFYIALFKFINVCSVKGFNDTALELTKILVNLSQSTSDPDPLATVLMIDYLCLRAQQYDFFIRYFNTYNCKRNLSLMPNFVLSLCLVKFKQNPSDYELNKEIQDAILKFPGLIILLLNNLNIILDSSLSFHHIFTKWADSSESPSLKSLYNLYVKRCAQYWNDRKIIDWLIQNIHEVCLNFQMNNSIIEQIFKTRVSKYQILPNQIKRHLTLCSHLEISLPQNENSPHLVVFDHDPFPPNDTIDFYQNKQSNPIRNEESAQGLLSSIISSIIPNYDSTTSATNSSHSLNDAIRRIEQTISDRLNTVISLNSNNTDLDNHIDENQID